MVLSLVSVCLLSSPPEVKPLAHSYRDGDIAVEARSHLGYEVSFLKIENRREAEIGVDINGSYLRPEVRGIQRIGLGLVRKGERDTTLRLKAGETLEVNVLSVCMDQGKSPPGNGTRLILARELAPPHTKRMLERWKAKPHLSQSDIQRAVWKRRPTRRRVIERIEPPNLLDGVIKLLSANGTVFLLKKNGDLFSGTSPARMSPAEGQFSDLWRGEELYAIRRSFAGAGGAGGRGLVHFDFDADRWIDCHVPAPPGRLIWVGRGGREAIIQEDRGGPVRVDRKGSTRILRSASSIGVTAGGLVYWSSKTEPSTLRITDLKGSQIGVLSLEADVADLACAGNDAFVLDKRGALFAIRGRALREVRRGVETLIPCGAAFIASSKRATRETRSAPRALYLITSGEPVREIASPEALASAYDLDTGELYCYTAEKKLLWRDLDESEWVEMEVRRAGESSR